MWGSVMTMSDSQVTVEEPPEVNGWSRRSFWVKALEAARKHNSWVRVHRLYTEKTASQIASDLRSVHRREANNVRVRGIMPGERWDARRGRKSRRPGGSVLDLGQISGKCRWRPVRGWCDSSGEEGLPALRSPALDSPIGRPPIRIWHDAVEDPRVLVEDERNEMPIAFPQRQARGGANLLIVAAGGQQPLEWDPVQIPFRIG